MRARGGPGATDRDLDRGLMVNGVPESLLMGHPTWDQNRDRSIIQLWPDRIFTTQKRCLLVVCQLHRVLASWRLDLLLVILLAILRG